MPSSRRTEIESFEPMVLLSASCADTDSSIIGTSCDDTFVLNDQISQIDGAEGFDTLRITDGVRGDFEIIQRSDGSFELNTLCGQTVVELINVEQIVFADCEAFDLQPTAEQATASVDAQLGAPGNEGIGGVGDSAGAPFDGGSSNGGSGGIEFFDGDTGGDSTPTSDSGDGTESGEGQPGLPQTSETEDAFPDSGGNISPGSGTTAPRTSGSADDENAEPGNGSGSSPGAPPTAGIEPALPNENPGDDSGGSTGPAAGASPGNAGTETGSASGNPSDFPPPTSEADDGSLFVDNTPSTNFPADPDEPFDEETGSVTQPDDSESNSNELPALPAPDESAAAAAVSLTSEAVVDSSESTFVARVLELTNEIREQNGLAPLTLNSELQVAAQLHAENLANQDFFDHVGRDGSRPWDRAEAAGYDYRSIGENIAAGQLTPEEVVQGWYESAGHRANILNPTYEEIGIGYSYLANDTGNVNYNRYWSQLFGSER